MTSKTGSSRQTSFVSAYAVETAIGRRAEQQDSAWAGPVRLADGRSALLLLIADGMGGATGGKIASSVALDAFRAKFEADSDISSLKTRLRTAMDAANDAIAGGIAANRALEGMGTTFVGAVVSGSSVVWISVGDSLLLKVSDGTIERLNEDHSLAAVLDQAAERGEISASEAQSSNQRNVLRSALTGDRIALVEVNAESLKRGTWLIAATDGILTIPFSKVASLAAGAREPQALAQNILAAVLNDMPSDQDNVTVVTTRMGSGGPRSRGRVPLWAILLLGFGVVAFVGALALLAAMLFKSDDNDVAERRADPANAISAPTAQPEPQPKAAAADNPAPVDEAPVGRISTSGLEPVGTDQPASTPASEPRTKQTTPAAADAAVKLAPAPSPRKEVEPAPAAAAPAPPTPAPASPAGGKPAAENKPEPAHRGPP